MREQRNDPKRLKDILQAIDTIFEYVGDRGMEEFLADMTDRLAFKVYQPLACVSPYPVISLPYQCIYLCFCMSNTKLPDFPKATSALVNNSNADRA